MASSSIVSNQNQIESHETIRVSSEWQDKEQSSSGSVKNAEECLLKLKLGRKRGRPTKRKSKKGNKPFALITTKSQLVCHGGSSEAEKIYESCLLMGLEGKVDREEAIKRIADRIREN